MNINMSYCMQNEKILRGSSSLKEYLSIRNSLFIFTSKMDIHNKFHVTL